jgi:hypothetical protein
MATGHKDCYGAMFPPTLQVDADRPVRGKVFAYQLLTPGGIMRADRRISADVEAWDECVTCDDFDHCYKLSLGRLLLEVAINEK